jgi:uncharacterized protein involved in outer membrane biogenesis
MRRWLLGAAGVVVLAACAVYFGAGRALGTDAARIRIEQQLTARLEQPVRIGSVRAAIFPGIAVDLRDVTIGEPVALHLGRIKILTGLGALFADTIDIREISVTDGRPGGAQPGFAFDLTASVQGDRLEVTALTARGPTMTIVGQGELTSIANLDGTFEVRSDLVDLSELIAIGAALAPASGRGRTQAEPSRSRPMHFVVTATAPRVRFGAHEFRDLLTTIDVVPSRVVLDRFNLGGFGGRFDGVLRAATGTAVPVLNLTGTLRGADAAELLKLTGSAGGINGRLDATVALTGAGTDAATVLRSAHGTIDASLSNGSMPKLDLVRTIVLAFGKPSGVPPEGSGTAFDRMAGTFALSAGTLRSENLRLSARDFDASGRGTLAIESGAVDARADVILSPELTAQAGTDLRRYAQEDGRVVVPATVGGTLTKPTIFIDVAAAMRRAFTNELKRRATDFLGGLFKKKKGGGS